MHCMQVASTKTNNHVEGSNADDVLNPKGVKKGDNGNIEGYQIGVTYALPRIHHENIRELPGSE